MTRPLWLLLLLVAWNAGCAGTPEGQDEHERHDDEEGEAHDDDGEGEAGHPGEVHVSAEAQERAGIRLGRAERRALRGGVAIPAEVQFEPSSTAHVSPLAPGRITAVSVALGDSVRRGQVLGVVASIDVSTARASLNQARTRLTAAEATLRRQQQLATEGIGAQRELIGAEAQVGELRAEVQGLQRQLSVFGSGRAGELALTSPIDGVVVAMHGTLGETATPEQPVFIVTDPLRVFVRGNVPELEISHVTTGAAAVVRLHAFPDLVMSGSVTYVAPALDELTRSLPIRVMLETPDARLRSGLFGSIELLGGSADERPLVVPVEAIATLDGQTVVFLVGHEPNRFEVQPVALGRRAGGLIEVRSGIEEGAELAVSGAFTLKSAVESGELSAGHAH
ncbi:MAG: efflux RND transporter periplasmic adaptor subunit [Sandaracinaceae bacterium]|nr:efflux RND transporter periplasmic adaptor subunit [Sandaracinaceae bacterium]MBK8588865.1 efflux RND transporter periplasmic adaptor subunit [Sandaracinaceae bacterium]MBP7684251.1 efflux RND transporter periplasmic adaptor subunit [Deltaproteobacteria bacterium]